MIALAGAALAALDFADWMIPYLTLMALAAPCLIGVLWLDDRRGVRTTAAYRPLGLAAWGAGVALGVGLHLAGSPYALPAGLAASTAAAAAPVALRRLRGAARAA